MVGLWRLVACAAVLATAVGSSAQPVPVPAAPDVKGTDTAAERAKLQAELLALLKRMSANPAPVMPAPSPPSAVAPPKGGKTDPDVAKGPDPIREAMNRFRDNDFETARMIFQKIDPALLPSKEDRAFVRYMTASCLRRQGRVAEAEPIYREVANSPDDEFLASYATQQLSLISSERELQAQLEQLRSRAKSK